MLPETESVYKKKRSGDWQSTPMLTIENLNPARACLITLFIV
jgi:hypothetical protein